MKPGLTLKGKKFALIFYIAFGSFCSNAQTGIVNALTPVNNLNDQSFTKFSAFNSISKQLPDSNNVLPYALIAGGSKGIGYAIAEALARRNYNLILIARNKEDLLTAKKKLEAAYPVHVDVLSYDLSKEETTTAITTWCNERNIPLKMLCNVAGLGGEGDYLSLPLDTLRYMIHLNLESPMALTLSLLPLLEKNTPAYILNVASMAGFGPIPSKNLYAATKAGLVSFSYSLRYQLRTKNISVSCLAPGPVYTKESIKVQTKKLLGWLGNAMAMKPAKVGEVAVRKTLKGRMIIVPGGIAKILSIVLRIAPQRWVAWVYGKSADRSECKEKK